MSDAELQALRQRWRRDGDPAAEYSLLAALRRHGHLDDFLVSLAAACGSAGALRLRDELGARPFPDLRARGSPGLVLSVVRNRLSPERETDAEVWTALHVVGARERSEGSVTLQRRIEGVLAAPRPGGLEALRRAIQADPGQAEPWTMHLARDCLRGTSVHLGLSIMRPIYGMGPYGSMRDQPKRRAHELEFYLPFLAGLQAWVRSGPLAHPTLAELRRERRQQVIDLRLAATPARLSVARELVAWLERLGGGAVLRIDADAEPLPLVASDLEGRYALARDRFDPYVIDLGAVIVDFPSPHHSWLVDASEQPPTIHFLPAVAALPSPDRTALAAHLLVTLLIDLLLRRSSEGWRGSGLPKSIAAHDPPRGCAFDACSEPEALLERARAGRLCRPCRLTLRQRGLAEPIVGALDEVLTAAGEALR